jgi:hypothetical protein
MRHNPRLGIVPQVVESDSWHFGGLASLDPQSDDLRHGQVEGEALGGDFGRFRGKRNEARAPGLRAAVDAYRAADNIGRGQTQGFRTPQAGERQEREKAGRARVGLVHQLANLIRCQAQIARVAGYCDFGARFRAQVRSALALPRCRVADPGGMDYI